MTMTLNSSFIYLPLSYRFTSLISKLPSANFLYLNQSENLDKDDLGTNRTIAHLSLLSKLTERVVKLRLVDYLSTNSFLNAIQSAYIKRHSTETTVISVHDHIIKAMSHQQVTCLTHTS